MRRGVAYFLVHEQDDRRIPKPFAGHDDLKEALRFHHAILGVFLKQILARHQEESDLDPTLTPKGMLSRRDCTRSIEISTLVMKDVHRLLNGISQTIPNSPDHILKRRPRTRPKLHLRNSESTCVVRIAGRLHRPFGSDGNLYRTYSRRRLKFD